MPKPKITYRDIKNLHTSGRVGAFVYKEGFKYPIRIDKPYPDNAVFDNTLAEQRWSDLIYEAKSIDDDLMKILIIAGVIVFAIIVIGFVMLGKGGAPPVAT